MMTSRVLVDSNVLVLSFAKESPLYAAARARLDKHRIAGNTLCLASQVNREVLVALTRPGLMNRPLDPEQACRDMKLMERGFQVLPDSDAQRKRLYELVGLFGVSGKPIHDANLVAAYIEYRCDALLTHNLADFKRYSGIINLEALEG